MKHLAQEAQGARDQPISIAWCMPYGKSSQDLEKLVYIGNANPINLYDPPSEGFVKETHSRPTLEREAAAISPPPRGQNVRAPIDGVSKFRCVRAEQC